MVDDRGVKMPSFRRDLARRMAQLANGVYALIGVAGLGVAVTLTSCETDSSSLSRRAGREPAATRHAGKAGGDGPGSGGSGGGAGASRELPPVRITAEPQLRVRVLTAVETVTLASSAGLTIGSGDPKGLVALPAGAKTERVGATVAVSCRGGQWFVSEPGRPARTLPAAGASLVVAAEGGGAVGVGSASYPGTLRLTARTDLKDGAFDVIEFVGVEDYLPGVVAKEMLSGWPAEAYRAQAVAARTYALHERERSLAAGQPFDLESSDRDQVYGGATTNGAAVDAVRGTRGVVLMDGERLLRAYFSSTCGGRTASARDTWPTGPGYEYNLAGPIQARHRDSACSASPLYRWQVERPRAELVRRMRAFGERQGLMVRRIKDLAAVEAMAYNEDGRPSRYKIIEPGGAWYQLSAEELRLASNASVVPPGAGGARSAASPGGPTLAGASASAGPQVGVTLEAAPALAPLPDIDRKTRVNSGDFEVTVRGDRVLFTGRGFGHGVGLCQYCAKAFAERGETWRPMVERFYPGARVVGLY